MNLHAVALAVVAGRPGQERGGPLELSTGLFHGTAFCLAPNLFLTAAHVYRDAEAAGEVVVARLTPGLIQGQPVTEAEVFEGIDLALLQCPGLVAEIAPFSFDALPFLADVVAVGFPFGLELGTGAHTYHLRAFKGYVVTRRGLRHLRDAPPGYEVSFIPPAGLSGAPLIVPGPTGGAVTGMILTHHIAEYRDRRMELGLALDLEELLTLDSQIVGGSIAERLFRRPKVTRPQR